MKSLAIFITHLLHLTVAIEDTRNIFCHTPRVPDYYWREYKGLIPFDVVPGGTDRSGYPTYIGQALVYPWGLLPASIYHGNKTVITSANLKTYYSDKYVKILCSKDPDKFKWIATNTDKIQQITNCHLVLGGVYSGCQENIGRINYNEEIILGRIVRKPLSDHGLWIPYNGTEIKSTYYEVLAYDYYYWGDYRGTVPRDAVEGGRSRSGNPTYIGQVLACPQGLPSASIYPGNKVAVASAAYRTN